MGQAGVASLTHQYVINEVIVQIRQIDRLLTQEGERKEFRRGNQVTAVIKLKRPRWYRVIVR